MQGCRRACVIQLIQWAGIASAVYLYGRWVGRSGGEALAVSIGVGLLATMSLLVADSALRAAMERRMLRRAARGGALRDGKWTAVCGRISSSAPVRAPLSGELAVAYEYSIGRQVRVGKSTSLQTYFDGKALAASTITTDAGPVRLLSVPTFEVEATHLDAQRALSNAREYVRRASFETRDTASQRTSALEREWTDDDGVFRIDKKHSASEVELDARVEFEERHIRPGDVVCAFGVYSSERRGLVPDAQWGRPSRLMRAAATDAARALRGRVIRYLILSLSLAALAVWGTITYFGR